ncbi:MAG: PH domain-containing protein [Candidatus Sumerlaeaceae bacterium]
MSADLTNAQAGSAGHGLDAMDAAALTGMATATEKGIWDEYPSLRTAFPPVVFVLVLWVVVMLLIRFLLPLDRRPVWNGHDALSWGLTLGVAAVVLLMLLRSLIRLRSIRYRLTSQRIFITFGILNKRTDEIELEKYKDVFVNQDFWDKLVGCGDIQVVTGDVTNPTINMDDVIDPIGKKESIRNAARERQAKLGLRLREQM